MDNHQNLAYSTIATAPSPALSGTSATVTAGHGSRFPAGSFNATIWPSGEIPTPANAEIVRVTSRAGDVLTIQRAQEGTAAVAILVGYQIAATVTAKVFTDIEAALVSHVFSGNTAGVLATVSSGSLVLAGGNNITLSQNGNSVTVSGASIPAQTVQTQNLVSVQGSTGAISFANSNGITIGGNASTLTLSHNGLTSQSNQAFSAQGGSSAFQTIVFANSNGVSFTNTNGSLAASVATNYAASDHSHGNPTLALTNLSGTTASNSAGLTLSLSAAAPGGGGAFTAGVSGGNTSGDSGTVTDRVVFAGGNNITLSGSTNGGSMTITISGANAGGAQTGISGVQVSDATYTSGTVTFRNANGMSFGSSGAQGISASYTVPSTVGLISHVNISGGTTSNNLAALTFANGNGVSFGLDGSTLTGSVHTSYAASNHSHGNPTLALTNLSGTTASNSAGLTLSLSAGSQSHQTVGLYASSNTTLTSSGTVDARSMTFRGVGAVSLGVSASEVLISIPQTSSLLATGIVSLSDNGSTISIGVGPATAYAVSNTTQGTSGSFDLRSVSFHGAGGVSVGVSNGSIVVSGATGGGGGGTFSAGVSNVGNTAGATGLTGTQMVFVGTGPISLSQTTGANGGTISINAPATSSLSATGLLSISTNGSTISIGAGPLSFYATSNTTQSSSGTIDGRSITIRGAGVASVGVSNGSIVLSVPSGGGAGDGVNILAAGTQTANTTGTVLFANSNGLTFGMSDSSVITASHNGLTTARASNDAVGLNTALTAGPLAWTVNSSGLSLNAESAAGTSSGFAGNSISGSITHNTAGINISLNHPAWLTTAMQSNAVTLSNIRVSAGTTSNLLSAVTFANGNGVSFGLDAGTVTASHNGLTTAAQSNHSHGDPQLNLTNLSGTTASNSAGFTLSLSAANPGLTTARASTDAIGLNTAQSNVTWTVNSSGLSLDARGYAGTGTAITGGASITLNSGGLSFNGTALAGTGTTFNGANISGSLTQNSAGLALSLSVAAPGAAAENNNIDLLGANTAGNTTASGSTIGWSGLNLTLSGTNASQVVISAPATSSLSATGILSISTNGSTISLGVPGAATRNYFNPQDGYVQVAGQQGNASLHLQPAYLPDVTFDRIAMPVLVTNATNSTGTVTVSFGFAVYTRNAATFSMVDSTSGSAAVTFSGTVNNSTFAGMRLLTIPWSSSFSEAQYYVGIWSRTTSGGANATINQYLVSQVNSVFSGLLGVGSNASVQYTRGLGHFSTTFSTALPSSVGVSDMRGSAAIVLRQPAFYLVNGTF